MIESLGLLTHVDADSPCLSGVSGCYCFQFEHQHAYLEPPTALTLHCCVLIKGQQRLCLITRSPINELIVDKKSDEENFHSIADQLDLKPIDLNQPLNLETIAIPKPWGQEIWYTGIEQRGLSTVNKVPLTWLLEVFEEKYGIEGDPLLLKILDPLPQTNLGDLYFEMHEQKVEVYVVTHIDQDAWPDGVGKIRYGFSTSKQKQFSGEQAFLEAYVNSVQQYQNTRHAIDTLIVEFKIEDDLGSTDAVAPETYQKYLDRVPKQLSLDELKYKEAMYDFTEMRDLTVGEVVTIEPLTPHSLQHGVRVVEFQTPHYERYILSFGQQVLTQDHWDTEMIFKHSATETTKSAAISTDKTIADFDEFKVERHQLSEGQTAAFSHTGYFIVMGISSGAIVKAGDDLTPIKAEQALLFSPQVGEINLSNQNAEDACVLIAFEPD